ncbi:ShlB/FhaC/HecB family hemolysin secretion/activation protein [Janthinobacterium sp.]|uniref:ShlB/FhaC/HecB family hemolysin secretion/activation protein n=1 Tax=Janthinobacterium sp. TaxID=1871054 RepID=UPI00293D4F03|nr:ShlB/FhaC/HecB family hemolysin secretion/activation protein [Janthinobacterium sp.]
MHYFDKTDRPPALRAICLALLTLGVLGAARAEEAAAQRYDLDEYIVRGNTVLDARAIETALTPFLGPQRTQQDIEAARDALLALYQAKGYQSVYVDLPAQPVQQGLVFLQVSETRVGRLRVTGAQYHSPLEVREQVPALAEGKVPDFNQAQLELAALNRGAKRQVAPLVRQGSVPGTMDVDLKVDDSRPWRASAGLHNDYSADTRKLRASLSLAHDNLWQMGHSVSLSFFGAPQDISQTKVWSASYAAPLPGSQWSLEATAYKSDSEVATLGGTSVLGKGHAFGLKASYTVPDTGAWWHAFSVGVDFKNNQEALRLGDTGDTVGLKYAPLTLAYNGVWQGERGQFGLGLSAISASRSFLGYGSDWAAFDYKRYKASPSMLLLKADLNGSYSFANEAQAAFRLALQASADPLVAGEQMAAGGMNSVRGYLSAESTGDYGAVASLELRSKPLMYFSPWVDGWRVYAFTDAGHLRLNEPLPEQHSRFTLASVGLGSVFKLGERVSGRIDFGYPLKDGARTERHKRRISFNLSAGY